MLEMFQNISNFCAFMNNAFLIFGVILIAIVIILAIIY